MLLVFLAAASAATLPGISIPFDVDADGRWVLAEDLPEALASAGAEPGWLLTEVDGLGFDDPDAVRRRVAAGPSRSVQLRFQTEPDAEEGAETILVARRGRLVHAQLVGELPWPDGFATPAGAWHTDRSGALAVHDAQQQAWELDPVLGNWRSVGAGGWDRTTIPEVFFDLSDAPWVVERPDELDTVGPSGARKRFADAARLPGFEDDAGDHLLVTARGGVEVLAVGWPRGTPVLASCHPQVPETCLASGMSILATLADRPGAVDEAKRQLNVGCGQGVHRACYEVLAIEQPEQSEGVDRCLDGDLGACNQVAGDRLRLEPDDPDDVAVGLLEHACALEGAGTLGERLRRVEDIGAGCVMLADAYDARGMPDLALLNLDQACVLGRADACDEATSRREQAFALRTVRECEDPDLPVAASCVELGLLLQETEVSLSTLDDFGAFLRGCTLGSTKGCIELGTYVDRWGTENARVAEAERTLKASCDAGEQRACLGTAHLLVRHDPRSAAYGQALTLFADTCAAGLAPACVGGAQQRRIGTARKTNAPEQLELWDIACDRHDADGCVGLGHEHARSRKTYADAFAAWTHSCDLGDAHSCTELGDLVEQRHDPSWEGEQPRDAYLTRACDGGDPEGCFGLARDLLPPQGEPPEQGYLLLERSCEGEYGLGCARLAQVHLDRKTSFDDEISARHLDTACDNGHYESCRVLGTMYLRGKGVERNRERASELLSRFRMNARRRHMRVGVNAGLPTVAGGELELVAPIPVGPALSVAGTYSYIPSGGSVLVLIEGVSDPAQAPDLSVWSVTGRLYPNTQGRGLYGAVGFASLTASGGSIRKDRERAGWSARIGLRNQSGSTFTGLEMGLGSYGVIELADFDEEEDGSFPLLVPTFAFSVGLATL